MHSSPLHHNPAFFHSSFNPSPSAIRTAHIQNIPIRQPRHTAHPVSSAGTPRRARTHHESTDPRENARHTSMRKIMQAQRLRKKGDWVNASSILRSIHSAAKNDTYYLNELLYVRAAQIRHSNVPVSPEKLYAQLYELAQSIPAPHKAATFNAMLMALRNNERKDGDKNHQASLLKVAATLFDNMLERSIFPDQFTMSILFQMCATNKHLQYTKYFDGKSREAFGFCPNVVSGSALIAAYAKCGQLDLVDAVLNDLGARAVELNERTYASIISAYHRSTNHAKVLKYFDAAMKSSSVVPNVYIFSSTLASCSVAKDSKNAKLVFDKMRQANVKPTEAILSTLFEIAIRSSDVQLGLHVLLDWAPKYAVFNPQRSHFNRLISSCKNSTNSVLFVASSARDIVYRMEHDANVKPAVDTYNALMSVLVKLGLFREAYEVLENDILKSGLEPSVETYNTIIYSLGQSGKPQLAVQLFENMKKRGLSPSQATYNILLNVMVEAKDTKMAAIISNEMRNDPTVAIDAITFSSSLKHFRTTRDSRSAMKLFSDSIRDGNKLDERAHGLLLTILFEAGCQADAISVLGWLFWKRIARTIVCNVTLDHLGRNPDSLPLCFTILDNMKKKRIAPDAKTYAVIIRSCSRHGQIDRAFRFLGEMQDVGIGLTDTFAWTALIDGCGRVGQWQRAVELLKSMQQADAHSKFIPHPTTASYNAALYAAGMNGGGWKVTADIFKGLVADESQEPDMVTYSAMASAILQNRDEVADWDIVRNVYNNLKAAAEENETERANASRRSRKPSRSNKQGKPFSRKLSSKMKRLDWLLRTEDGKSANRGRTDGLESP